MKAYTDLEQSKILAKILPIESADMRYSPLGDNMHPWIWTDTFIEKNAVPCWSLAALLEQIPSDIKTKDGCNYTLEIEKCDAEHLPCGLNYHDNWGRGEDIITHYYDNFIDSSYEMIVKLHELKLL